MYVFIDAETVGLYGLPFSIAAILMNDAGIEIKRFTIRRELTQQEISFAEKEIYKNDKGEITFSMPACIEQSNSIENVAFSYEDMLKKFSKFYLENKENATCVWHMGNIVEAFLFRECVRLGFLEQFDGPYTPIDISNDLRIAGFAPDSVDSYVTSQSLNIQSENTSHHPLYDCQACAVAFFDLQKKNAGRL